MEILPGIIADHTALWFEKYKILCLADLHLGYDEELYRKGVHVPTNEWQYQRNLISKLMAKYKPKIVLLNGDVKHGFSGINDREWRHTVKLFDLISEHAQLVLIKGNHDNILEPIARTRKIVIENQFIAGDILFMHGDILPEKEVLKNIKTVVIGHEHPSVNLSRGVRSEQYKCFLALPWNKRTLIVQPSTFSLTIGADIANNPQFGPFLKKTEDAIVYVVGEDGVVLNFGSLSALPIQKKEK